MKVLITIHFFCSQTNNPNNLMLSNVSTSGQSQNSEETITLYAGGAGSNENSRSDTGQSH